MKYVNKRLRDLFEALSNQRHGKWNEGYVEAIKIELKER